MPANLAGERNKMLRKTRLTHNSLREAISSTVRELQGDKTDNEMADEWGTSAGTVANARNKNHTIGLEPFLRLGKEYGPHGVDTALALVGLRSQPMEARVLDISKVPHDVAKCLPLLIERLSDGEWSDDDQVAFERAGIIHTMLDLADQMRDKRDARRLRAVGA
jgi:hypothetical protein